MKAPCTPLVFPNIDELAPGWLESEFEFIPVPPKELPCPPMEEELPNDEFPNDEPPMELLPKDELLPKEEELFPKEEFPIEEFPPNAELEELPEPSPAGLGLLELWPRGWFFESRST